MIFLLKYWKFIAIGAVFIGIVIISYKYQQSLIKQGYDMCINEQKEDIIEAQENRQRINHEVKNINRDTIIQRLDDGGWLRND